MVQNIQKKLNDSAFTRWSALILIALMMFFAYMFVDMLSPLKSQLEASLGWTSGTFGTYAASEYFLNVFCFFLIFAGIILDKMGIRFTGVLSASLMVIGASIKFYAMSDLFIGSGLETWMNSWWVALPGTAKLSCLGFMIFGCGCEMAGTTVSKAIAKWFNGKEMAMAMGLEMSIARLGVFAAMWLSPLVYEKFGAVVSAPVGFGAILLLIGLIFYVVFVVMDRKFDASATDESASEEGFSFGDLKLIFTNKGFWLIAILCVLFYSGVFPFLKFATKLMIYKYNVDPELAGLIPAMLPFGTILLTPVFGSMYDRMGKGATLMIIGSFMLTLVHVLFALPILNVWWFAIVVMIILGVAFSLVPSAMWPAVPKIIPMKQLGSAYAIIFYIQNIGLSMVPVLIGSVIQKYAIVESAEGVTYDYTIPMAIFAVFGVVAVGVALLLKRVDKTNGYGLEQPNIQK